MYRAVEKYVVRLTAEKRAEWEALLGPSRVSAEKQLRARLLLKADQGEFGPAWLNQQLIEVFGVSRSKIMRLRRQFVGKDSRRCCCGESARSRAAASWTARKRTG